MKTSQPSLNAVPVLRDDKMPQHVAIIMDGNNRYGKKLGLPAGEGHKQGKRALDPIVEYARELGIKVLTVFAFSSENWQRSTQEVALLMQLLEEAIHEQIPRMRQHDIRLRFIGDRSKLSPELAQLMADAEAETAHYHEMTLVIAISYGGRWDMAHAAQQMARQVLDGVMHVDDINETTMQPFTALGDLPPVDLLIRTGGEYRISNFLLWQAAYAEYYFTDVLWPEFTRNHLDDALQCFAQRDRRFGAN